MMEEMVMHLVNLLEEVAVLVQLVVLLHLGLLVMVEMAQLLQLQVLQ